MKYLSLCACIFLMAPGLQAQNVGIGTPTPDPAALLHVNSINKGVLFPTLTLAQKNAISNPPRGLLVYQLDNDEGFWVNKSRTPSSPVWSLVSEGKNYWSLNGNTPGDLYATHSGNLGIGTSNPAQKLTIINGQILLSRSLADSNDIIFNMPAPNFITPESEGLKFRLAGVDRASVGYLASPIGGNVLRISGNGVSSSDLTINSSGYVGVGTSQQTEKFQVNGNALVSNGGILYVAKASGQKTVEIKPTESGSDGASILLYNSAGAVKIELDADYADGDGRVITSELQINGGSDLAENFDIQQDDLNEMLPGMLVSIDPENEGKLTLTKVAGDKKVVGVISGANGIKAGMIMGQTESVADGKYPIALAGRVYVLANDEEGIISAGDFLTSSSKPGYAKKVSNIVAAQGSIIGKAMGSVDPKTGFVLVLINLQ